MSQPIEAPYDPADVEPWTRLEPPYFWGVIGKHVIADRHLPDGTRQHMIRGHVPPGTVIHNAQILGELDVDPAELPQ